MGKKKVKAVLRLNIEAGKATPGYPIGPALGQHQVNIMEFCRAYNEQTESQSGSGDPRGDHHLRGPHLHLHHQDPARPRT